jgi:phosphate uptake regulator
MGIFRKHDPKLVDIAFKKAIMMLELGQEMFCIITDSLVKDTEPEKAANIKRMDKEINQMHREINRQIFEHLSVYPDGELFPCLVLINVVKDSERIGDYNKNRSSLKKRGVKRGKCSRRPLSRSGMKTKSWPKKF